MVIPAGALDQRPIQEMANYGLIYRSDVLEDNLTVGGRVELTLHVSSDCPDTDFIVKLIDLHPDGSAILMMDGVIRAMFRDDATEPQPFVPQQVVAVRISLGQIHHTFLTGHRLEVDVTSSNFPRRIRNTNSGNPQFARDGNADMRVANNVVHHDALHPSVLVLSVLAAG